MKKFYLLATALVALASCTSDEYIGDPSLAEANGSGAISFNSSSQALTRADKTGAAAATDLNNQFYVFAVKNETADALNAASAGNLVYNNYVVKYGANTAHATTSNTQNWEYVGYALSEKEAAKITVNSGKDVAQTIKYWDWGATDYTFYAFSALPTDISGDKVAVAKTTSVSSTSTVFDKGYTVTLATGANLDKLFFAERVNIVRS
ncbi:MAG: hypothetical protein K6F94_03570, partial [Bacteroidaceae bacterium]|nr:hypothetical protein [Bacteroidaceae bacterium]